MQDKSNIVVLIRKSGIANPLIEGAVGVSLFFNDMFESFPTYFHS